jgi:hypothetical protein
MELTYKGLILPTPEEEAEIQRGIELDPDTIDLSDERIPLRRFSMTQAIRSD